MRRRQMVLLALVAVFALGAALSASAMADKAETTLLAEWLKAGTGVVGSLAAKTTGSVTLIHLNLAKTTCSGSFDGTVGVDGVGQITEALNTKEEKVREGLTGTGVILECTNVENCEKGEVVPVDLPWDTILYLMENGSFLDLIYNGGKGEPGYEVACTVLGIKVEEKCVDETSAVVENMSSEALLGTFSVADQTEEKLEQECKGTAQIAALEGIGSLTLNNGESLTASEGTLPEGTLLAEWLKSATAVAGNLAATATGSVVIHLNRASTTCTGSFDGTVGTNGVGAITEVLNVKGEKTREGLTGTGVILECTNVENCGTSEVVPVHLPWATILYLMANGTFLDLIYSGGKGEPAYELSCTMLGIKIEELCVGQTSAIIQNMPGEELLGTFSVADQEIEKLEQECGSGLQVTAFEGNGSLTLNNGERLTASSEGAGE